MVEFFSGLALIIISGLGFVCYKHPELGSKICERVTIVILVCSFISFAYLLGETNGVRATSTQKPDDLLSEIGKQNFLLAAYVGIAITIMVVLMILSSVFARHQEKMKREKIQQPE